MNGHKLEMSGVMLHLLTFDHYLEVTTPKQSKSHFAVFNGLISGSLEDCMSSLEAGGGPFFMDCSLR